MPTVEIDRGQQFEIRAWSDDGKNVPLLDFLSDLRPTAIPTIFAYWA